jgi:predicted ribosomally synthesized peptide with nif11-like leader
MSVKNVHAFFAKAAEDKDLQKKLKALGEREEAMYAELVKTASATGFQFTTADARKARASAARKLSAQELDAVAGGAGQGTVNLQRICVLLWPNV